MFLRRTRIGSDLEAGPKIKIWERLFASATAADVAQILAFIRALAAFERAPDAVVATEEGLLRDGFGPNPYYSCLIAEHDGQPAGFALFFFNYSTWMGRPGIYLEDLFVLPEFRGRGIGKALLQARGGDRGGEGLPAAATGRFWTGIRRRLISIARWARSFMDEWRTGALGRRGDQAAGGVARRERSPTLSPRSRERMGHADRGAGGTEEPDGVAS